MTNRKSQRVFDWCQNQRPLMTLGRPWSLRTLSQNTYVFRSPPRKCDRPILVATKMQPNDSRFCQYKGLCGYSRGFPGDGASNESGVIENIALQGFGTLRLRHFRKWGKRYYNSHLSPFHRPQNTWPWMILNGWMAIYVKFSLLRTGCERKLLAGFESNFYLFTVQSVYIRVLCAWPEEMWEAE